MPLASLSFILLIPWCCTHQKSNNVWLIFSNILMSFLGKKRKQTKLSPNLKQWYRQYTTMKGEDSATGTIYSKRSKKNSIREIKYWFNLVDLDSCKFYTFPSILLVLPRQWSATYTAEIQRQWRAHNKCSRWLFCFLLPHLEPESIKIHRIRGKYDLKDLFFKV